MLIWIKIVEVVVFVSKCKVHDCNKLLQLCFYHFYNFEKILGFYFFNMFDLQSIGDAEQARKLLSKARLNKIICYPSKYNWIPQKQDIHWNSNINKNMNNFLFALVETTWLWSEIHIFLRYNLERKLIVSRYAKQTQARQISRQKLKVTIGHKQTRETFADQLSWVRS